MYARVHAAHGIYNVDNKMTVLLAVSIESGPEPPNQDQNHRIRVRTLESGSEPSNLRFSARTTLINEYVLHTQSYNLRKLNLIVPHHEESSGIKIRLRVGASRGGHHRTEESPTASVAAPTAAVEGDFSR